MAVSELRPGDVVFHDDVEWFVSQVESKVIHIVNPNPPSMRRKWRTDSNDLVLRVLNETTVVVGLDMATQRRFFLASDLDGSDTLVMENDGGWPPRLYAKTSQNGAAKCIVAALNAMEK